MDDKDYMKRALELAKKGEGFVSPNPMVGAVIVKDGEIIAEGWHEKYGDLHAERNALKHCTQSAEGADMYAGQTSGCQTRWYRGIQPSLGKREAPKDGFLLPSAGGTGHGPRADRKGR